MDGIKRTGTALRASTNLRGNSGFSRPAGGERRRGAPMTVKVLPDPRHALRGSARLSAGLAGDGLLVRMRSIVIAMLGVVTAVGLALVAVVSQVGWPSVLSGPLPQAPGPSFVRNATIVAPPSPSPRRGSPGQPRRRLGRAAPPSAAGTANLASELTAASPVESPAPSTPPGPRHPSAPDSNDQGAPSAPSPAPTPGASPTSPSDEADQGDADPPTGKTPNPPVAAAPESPESSPGHSGESHGGGPPPWAGRDDSGESHGKDSWDHGHDDHGGGWGHD